MGGMRFRPRFSLRTLLIGLALLSIPMAWVAYQLNWIRQRHEFLANPNVAGFNRGSWVVADTPWQLKLFGEYDATACLSVPLELADEARRLFPGVSIVQQDPSTKK